VNATLELSVEEGVDCAVALQHGLAVKGRAHHDHLEMGLRATRHAVHMALVDDVKMHGLRAHSQTPINQ
jgi:hypothetical protein